MRAPPRIGVNLLPEAGWHEAALPLFADGLIDALEWDIDEAWGFDDAPREVPAWAERVLDLYADDDALYGHGVWFSLLSARPEARQARWLEHLAAECARRHYRHVTEHFAWLSAGRFARNTNLPCPRCEAAIAIGADRVAAIRAVAGRPVGLENNAAALAPADALEQGAFLGEVLARADAFLLLDVHNLWMQAVNLDLDPRALLDTYPLDRVRELHVAGGNWWRARDRDVRTDSHDHDVPAEVLPLVRAALDGCANLEVVFLERQAGTLDSDAARDGWRRDFLTLRELAS